MLTVDPKLRPSARQLLSHSWLKTADNVLTESDLTHTQAELKRFNAKRKFRAAVDAIVIANKMVANVTPSKEAATPK
jgi:calcium/calmodulin-dependent protein kinase I